MFYRQAMTHETTSALVKVWTNRLKMLNWERGRLQMRLACELLERQWL